MYLSQPIVSSVYRPSIKVFLPLDYIEDQASSRLTVGYSESTAIQHIETILDDKSAVEGLGQISSKKRPLRELGISQPDLHHYSYRLFMENRGEYYYAAITFCGRASEVNVAFTRSPKLGPTA